MFNRLSLFEEKSIVMKHSFDIFILNFTQHFLIIFMHILTRTSIKSPLNKISKQLNWGQIIMIFTFSQTFLKLSQIFQTFLVLSTFIHHQRVVIKQLLSFSSYNRLFIGFHYLCTQCSIETSRHQINNVLLFLFFH